MRISGQYLKLHGIIEIESKTHAIIKIIETGGYNRTYFYGVVKAGAKYTRPYEIKCRDLNYYIKKINTQNYKW